MSTKIYVAWVVEENELLPFIDAMRNRILKWAEGEFDETVTHLKKKYPDKNPQEVNREAQIIFSPHTRNPMCQPLIDLDFGLNIWYHNRRFYIIPIGSYRFKDSIPPEHSKDFAYWDNVDPPTEDVVSSNEWEDRGQTWEQLNCGEGVHSHNARRMYHEIINNSENHSSFFYKMTKKYLGGM